MHFLLTRYSFTHLRFAACRAILSERTFGSIANPVKAAEHWGDGDI
jgi:hypothetical protein